MQSRFMATMGLLSEFEDLSVTGDGGVRTSVSFLYKRVVRERNRDASRTTTPAGGLRL